MHRSHTHAHGLVAFVRVCPTPADHKSTNDKGVVSTSTTTNILNTAGPAPPPWADTTTPTHPFMHTTTLNKIHFDIKPTPNTEDDQQPATMRPDDWDDDDAGHEQDPRDDPGTCVSVCLCVVVCVCL